MTNESDLEAVNSPEYRAALMAQIDYDSTREGQAKLHEALSAAADPDARRDLRARQIAGASSARFRREQVALMPAGRAPGRRDPAFTTHGRLAQAREDLARRLGIAAAEADAFGSVMPGTLQELVRIGAEIIEADRERRGADFVPSIHPGTISEDVEACAPWALSDYEMPVEPGDVGVLGTLGVAARWDRERQRAIVDGDAAAAERWGYGLASDRTGSCVIATGPDVVKFIARHHPTG
ncbi:hypothetical protein [Cellulomonas shaoxiangyii]|uniref:Uncharacterized protein n=1 Tax=Cellulomonas shaoxiangyii TaxID=2566013 RepID=A0A4P7SGF5_9CELL|nr:hypothetical protein [Cellulomonas shaoxiangyii]QCB93052.1 hypothetical protein E5225_05255 [Cellulomonas shaoxiangyii]TGY84679.1 hypothetical protein E5226_10110 [Cellulomonas shaoxiangyii]